MSEDRRRLERRRAGTIEKEDRRKLEGIAYSVL